MKTVAKFEPPNKSFIVDKLKSLLSRAESGEIRELMVMVYTVEGVYETAHSRADNLAEMIGEIELFKQNVLRRMQT